MLNNYRTSSVFLVTELCHIHVEIDLFKEILNVVCNIFTRDPAVVTDVSMFVCMFL